MQKLAEIKWSDFIRGESPSDFAPTAGFSPSSAGLNLTKSRGKLHFTEVATDIGSTVLTGDIIAATQDKSLSGNDGQFLDDEGALYTLAANGTFTQRRGITGYPFQRGTSDILQFRVGGTSNNASLVSTFVTSETSISMLGGANLDEQSETAGQLEWWTGLKSGVRHPLEIIEGRMFVGDFNEIHTWNETSSTAAWVTLPLDVNITTMRKHPNGQHLIAFCGLGQNYGHTRNTPGRVYIVDVVTRNWIKEIDINSQVEGSRNAGGVIYVTYGDNLGFFNGEGITFIRKLTVATTDTISGNATYSHNMASMEDILIVRDNTQDLAYGDLGAGRVFWKQNFGAGRTLTCVFYRGDNRMLYAYQTAGGVETLVQIDYDNVGAGGLFTTNHIHFPTEVHISRVDILHDTSDSAGTTRFQIESLKHDGGGTDVIEDRTYTNQTTNKSVFNVDIRTDIFQLRLTPQNDDIGFHSIRIYGEPI